MAKKPKPATRRKPDTSGMAEFAMSSVDTAQTTNRWATRSRPDWELAARAVVGTYYAACNLLATVATAQTLRLFKPSGTGSKIYASAKVKGRKKMDWLTGQGVLKPGRKAQIAASVAEECEEVLEHPVLDRLYMPVPHMTFSQWAWLLHFWGEASGRGFVWMGDGGEPTLYPMAPQYTNVVGSKSQLIEKYRYGRDSASPIDLRAEDVMYFRDRIHPSDPLGAVSWAHSVVMQSDMESAALTAEIKRWENGGMPGGAIEIADGTITNADQMRQYRTDFESAYRGVQNAGRWMLIARGKIVQNATKPHEMAYKDGLTLSEERIYRAAGIPDTVWRMGDANRASAVMGDPQFMGYRILPKINAFADTLTTMLLPRYEGTEGWWFAFDNPVAEDVATVRATVESMTDRGMMTGNEGRTLMGYDPAGPELDVYRYQGVPLALKDAPPQPPMPFGAGPGKPEPEEPDETKPEPKDEPKEPEPAKELEPAEEAKAIDAHSLTCHCGKAHVVAKSMAEAESAFARELRDWYNRAVAQAMTPGGGLQSVDSPELQAILDRGLASVFRESALSSIAESRADIGQSIIDSAAATYARERSAELVTNLTETMRNEVRERIVTGIEEGRTVNEIRADLAESGIAEARTETIVRTETAMASQGAARRTYEAAGWEGKYWSTAGGPCPLCEAIEMRFGPNNPIPIDQNYFNAGDSIVGTDGKVYTFSVPVSDGVAHPNDRCASIYVEVMPEPKP